MAFAVDGTHACRDELIVLLSYQWPPIGGKQVAEHQVDLHCGGAQAEGKDILIPSALISRKIRNVRGVVKGTIELYYDHARTVLSVAA